MADRGTMHVNQALSNVAFGYKNSKTIWDMVMKPVAVGKETDKYFLFDDRSFMRYYGKIRANATESPRVNTYSQTTDTYSCEEHSYHDVVTDRDRNLADPIIKPDVRVTRALASIIDMDIEVDVASTVFNAANFSGMTSAPANKWNTDVADGTPLEDIDTAKRTVQKQIGVLPNTMVVGVEVHDQLKRHPDLLEIYKYTGKGLLSQDQVRAAFEIENYVVGEAIYVNTKKGQTETTDWIWGKYCALLYVPPASALEEPAWGYVFLHQLFGGMTAKTKKWREEGVSGDKIETSRSYDLKKTSKNAGYLYSAVIN